MTTQLDPYTVHKLMQTAYAENLEKDRILATLRAEVQQKDELIRSLRDEQTSTRRGASERGRRASQGSGEPAPSTTGPGSEPEAPQA